MIYNARPLYHSGGTLTRYITLCNNELHVWPTSRHTNTMCLTPVVDLSPEDIKAIRLEARVSQSVFARYLNVSPGVISQWERGEKHPSGASLKLLVIVGKKGLEATA